MLNSYFANSSFWIDFKHTISVPDLNTQFHLHDNFEIYFFIAGDANFFIEREVYPLKYGDLLLINSHEIHKATFSSEQPYERYVLHFEPELAAMLSSPIFNLLDCFTKRPQGERNKINLTALKIADLLKLFIRLENLKDNHTPSFDVLQLSCFIEILVLINQFFLQVESPVEEPSQVPKALIPVMDYIEKHLSEELTLQVLSQQFFMNPSYLSRLFKKGIGSNIHEFIIYKRIACAKKLLSQGHNVTETCTLCGFNDYANFLRMFKHKVGISPHQYKMKNLTISK
ncbi:MAG TPA: AraC family transcriptional regulator [Bacillota bacterium]|nr:AraC family transcriptional regulator [Bacillota bacterium]